MIETIPISVTSSTKTHNTSKIITAGDSGAYRLEITWSDLVTIVGSCQLYFVRGDGLGSTKDSSDGVVLSGNKVTYLLDESLYAVAGLTCWVQLTNSNLYTVLKIEFSGIRVPDNIGSIPADYSYPAWVTGKVAAPTAPYRKYAANVEAYDDGLNLQGKTLYIASSEAGKVAQIEVWGVMTCR